MKMIRRWTYIHHAAASANPGSLSPETGKTSTRRPIKLGTGPVAADGIDGRRCGKWEGGKESKHQIQPEYGQ